MGSHQIHTGLVWAQLKSKSMAMATNMAINGHQPWYTKKRSEKLILKKRTHFLGELGPVVKKESQFNLILTLARPPLLLVEACPFECNYQKERLLNLRRLNSGQSCTQQLIGPMDSTIVTYHGSFSWQL